MNRHHYLGFEGMVGESLRYVAESNGLWLALLGWQAAALKCRVLSLNLKRLSADWQVVHGHELLSGGHR